MKGRKEEAGGETLEPWSSLDFCRGTRTIIIITVYSRFQSRKSEKELFSTCLVC